MQDACGAKETPSVRLEQGWASFRLVGFVLPGLQHPHHQEPATKQWCVSCKIVREPATVISAVPLEAYIP